MSKEPIIRFFELTGIDRRTIKTRLEPLKGEKTGRSWLYESRDALPLIYKIKELGEDVLIETQERARLLHHQANNAAMKEKELTGELMPVAEVVQLGQMLVASAKSRLTSAHNRIKNRFSHLPIAVIEEIEQIHREALDELGTDGIHPEIQKRLSENKQTVEAGAPTKNKRVGRKIRKTG